MCQDALSMTTAQLATLEGIQLVVAAAYTSEGRAYTSEACAGCCYHSWV